MTENGQFPIPTTPAPAGWNGDIVYSKYRFDTDSSGGLMFSAEPSSLVVTGVSIEEFIASLVAGKTPSGKETVSKRQDGTPLDVVISSQCYIVLQLDPGLNWQFRNDGAPLTTKADYADSNAGLTVVADDGKERDPSNPGDGCHIAYYSAVARGAGEVQYFNLNVEFAQSGYRGLQVMIDPDNPNDGSPFP